jgi:hypothetical protein
MQAGLDPTADGQLISIDFSAAPRPHRLLPLGERGQRPDGLAVRGTGKIVTQPNRRSPHPALKRATFSQREKEGLTERGIWP